MKTVTILEEIDEIRKKIDHRSWVLGELKAFEMKYGLTTGAFVEKWRSSKIPEPEEHVILEEFLEWEGLAESLEKVETEFKELENRIRKS